LSLLGPNILLSALFSNTLSLCSSLSVRDQVSHPYKTTGKTTVLYTLNVMLHYNDICKIPEISQIMKHVFNSCHLSFSNVY
jgi:hypothetical protein